MLTSWKCLCNERSHNFALKMAQNEHWKSQKICPNASSPQQSLAVE